MTQGTAKLSALDVPPVSTTVILSGPGVATSPAGIAAVSRDAFTKVVDCAAPFQCTVEFVVKFEPTTLSMNGGPPCLLLLGDIPLTTGAGPGGGGGADAPPPPPHAVSRLKYPRTATCRDDFIEPHEKGGRPRFKVTPVEDRLSRLVVFWYRRSSRQFGESGIARPTVCNEDRTPKRVFSCCSAREFSDRRRAVAYDSF